MGEEKTFYEDERFIFKEKKRPQTKYPPSFCTAWMAHVAELVAQLTKREIRILFEILKDNGYQNKVVVCPSKIHQSIGTPVNHIQSVVKKLERMDVIRLSGQKDKNNQDVHIINCNYIWYGTPPDYWKFYFEWKDNAPERKTIEKLE